MTNENDLQSSKGCWTDIVDALEEVGGEAISADGFEAACLGFTYNQWDNVYVLVYDRDECIRILMDFNDWKVREAEEYFSFNTEGAYVGEGTPIFADIYSPTYEPPSVSMN